MPAMILIHAYALKRRKESNGTHDLYNLFSGKGFVIIEFSTISLSFLMPELWTLSSHLPTECFSNYTSWRIGPKVIHKAIVLEICHMENFTKEDESHPSHTQDIW